MRNFLLLVFTGLLLLSCGEKSSFESKNPYAKYFYPWDTVMKVYVFRDIANGLDEQFHRIYSIKDSEGGHIVVETYATDGRIIEAMNYNTDSLDVMDHMVVDRNEKKTKSELFKKGFMPMFKGQETYFASRFPGFLDSTLILREVKKKISKELDNYDVLGEKTKALVLDDHIRMTNFNPFTKAERVQEGEAISYYAEGYGLVEWHTKSKKVHYKLEKILSQEEWIKIITRECRRGFS
jgi:hypothetical protein